MTDFYLMTRDACHMDVTISYIHDYLRLFHKTKYVLLPLRASEGAKTGAAEAHKTLLKEQIQVSVTHLTGSAKATLRQENAL